MAAHPLETQIRGLVRRSRTWTVWQVACIVAAASGCALLIAAWLDFALRLQDRGVRTMLSLAVAACVAASVRVGVCQFRALRFDCVSVARELERRFPTLRGLLASAIEFLASEGDEVERGSATLRQATVERATTTLQSLDLRRAFDIRPVRRASLLALGVLALGAFSVGANPAAARLAVARLTQPWRDLAWPRSHQLELEILSATVSRGQSAELIVRDAASRLPEDVMIEIATSDAATPREMTPETTSDRREARYRIENVTQTLRVRAVGGDDREMPWRTIEVVEPPVVVWRVAQVAPPSYVAEPPRPLAQPIRALVGSRIDLVGQLDRPVKAATIKQVDSVQRRSVRLSIGEDERTVSTASTADNAWTLTASGAFAFEVEEELAAGQRVISELARWVVDVVEDAPPTVTLSQPAATAYALPEARLLVRGLARDDHQVERVELQSRLVAAAESSGEKSTTTEPTLARLTLAPRVTDRGMGGEQAVPFEGAWMLGDVVGLQPGNIVEYRVRAWDLKPQVGESEWRRLEVVTRDEFERRSSQREAAFLETLREAQRGEVRAATQTREVADGAAGQVDTTKESGRVIERLQSIELLQKNVRRLLSDEQSGLLAALASWEESLEQNNLRDSALAARWREFRVALAPLAVEELPAIERQLGHVVRTRREMPSEPVRDALQDVWQRQEKVVAVLERLVAKLAPWDRLQRQVLDLSDLRRAVAERRAETEQLLLEQSRVPKDDAARAAALAQSRKRLADEVSELSRRVERLLDDLGETRREMGETSDATTAVDRALAVAEQAAPGGRLREAGQAARDNRLGTSIERQEAATESLDQILDLLSNREPDGKGDHDPSADQRRQELSVWKDAVDSLVVKQSEVVKSGQNLAFDDKNSKESVRRWTTDQLQTSRLGADSLARLPPIPVFQFGLRLAVKRMEWAATQMEQGQRAAALEAAADARARLEVLRAAIQSGEVAGNDEKPSTAAKPPGSDPSERANERVAGKFSWAELQLVRDFQVDLVRRTEALEMLRKPDGTLDEAGRKQLRELAAEQAALFDLLKEMVP